jgi:hypothetical protein
MSDPTGNMVPMSHLFAVTNNPSCVSWCTVEHGPLDFTLDNGAFSCRRDFVDNDWFNVALTRDVEPGRPRPTGTVRVQVFKDDLPADQAARLADALASAADMLALDRWDTHGMGTPGIAPPVSKRILIERDLGTARPHVTLDSV